MIQNVMDMLAVREEILDPYFTLQVDMSLEGLDWTRDSHDRSVEMLVSNEKVLKSLMERRERVIPLVNKALTKINTILTKTLGQLLTEVATRTIVPGLPPTGYTVAKDLLEYSGLINDLPFWSTHFPIPHEIEDALSNCKLVLQDVSPAPVIDYGCRVSCEAFFEYAVIGDI
jgi:hypothetical protein